MSSRARYSEPREWLENLRAGTLVSSPGQSLRPSSRQRKRDKTIHAGRRGRQQGHTLNQNRGRSQEEATLGRSRRIFMATTQETSAYLAMTRNEGSARFVAITALLATLIRLVLSPQSGSVNLPQKFVRKKLTTLAAAAPPLPRLVAWQFPCSGSTGHHSFQFLCFILS